MLIPHLTRRLAVIEEARGWLGTPFLPQAAVKGEGTDCVMFFVSVYKAAGLVPADFDPRPYPSGCFLSSDDRRFRDSALLFATPVREFPANPLPADVCVFRLDGAEKHAVIVEENWPEIIHPVPDLGVIRDFADRGMFANATFTLWRMKGLCG